MRHAVVAAVAVVLLAGCGSSTGSSTVVVQTDSVAHPYTGPMSLKQDFSDDATVPERSGAAGQALECDTAPYDGGGGD